MTISDEDRLERARAHCFMAGVGDSGEALCRANMPFGLAKIHLVQERLGLPSDATFVGAPDATVTRNRPRWNAGFGYGGRIRWTGDFAVLDEKPNACGMLVGALATLPSEETLTERARAAAATGVTLEGVPLDFDISQSNHFVDVCEVRHDATGALPSRALFVMHSSGHEHRGPTARGPGLYHDKSPALAALAETHDTPWGPLSILRGDALSDWFRFVEEVQDFGLRRREALARALFGDFQVVQNAMHQGLQAPNDVNIGCYVFGDAATRDGTLFPLTLSADLPIHLVKPRPNLSDRILESLGWAERASRLGVLGRVRSANVLPHGGGYTYPRFDGVVDVRSLGPNRRVFRLNPRDGGTPVDVEDVRSLAHGYRGEEVLLRALALDLCEPAVVADVRYVLRTDDAPAP